MITNTPIAFVKVHCTEVSKTAGKIGRVRLIAVAHIVDVAESDIGGIDIVMDDGRSFHSELNITKVSEALKSFLSQD